VNPLPRAEPRTCGGCSACCYIPSLPELQKLAYTTCRHDTAKGCDAYAERPAPCRAYRCLWLDGDVGDVEDRPDMLGLAFDLPDVIRDDPLHEGIHVVCARELWPGGSEGPRASILLLKLAAAMLVRLTFHGGRTQVTGPRSLVERVASRARGR
jgi:hypothetical protein